MKKFVGYLFLVLIITVSVLYTLEGVYTYAFTHSKNQNRFDFILAQKNKHFNAAFVGSSRVVNNIVPRVFDDRLHTNTVNLGIMDAKPKDMDAIVKLLQDNNIRVDTLYVQVDYYYNTLEKSNFLYYQMLPYIHNYVAVRNYYKDEEDYMALKNLPFYRFVRNDSKLGIRALLGAVFKTNKVLEKTKGFEPLYGYGNTWQRILPDTILTDNIYISDLNSFAEKNRLHIKYFTAPFRSDTKQLNFIDSLKSKFPELMDFSKSITEDAYFKNGYHLNEEGAKKFSIIFANTLKK